jgi:hypothetical protein
MTYWTVLIITLLDPRLDGARTHLLYASEAECNAARSIVSDTLNYDHRIDCVVTEKPSASIRPKRRPDNL